jgi:L-aminopeptidase/D-esterase-like protein
VPKSPRPNDSITAVPGVRVGHYQRRGGSWLTGTTVVLVPDGATAGVDVRGGGPGTRETDLLRPENLVQQVHAICLTGGSAYGLAAADGVMCWCAERGHGFTVGTGEGDVVPIVPAAVIFDLARGGRFANRPDASFGAAAAARATADPVPSGTVGAGTGAVAGGIKGGTGSAAVVLDDGAIVAALAVVNAAGSLLDAASALPFEPHATVRLSRPDRADRRALADHIASLKPVPPPLNTTIGVVATSERLTKAECTKLAQVAHDGLARAARPSHLMVDGDTIFALSTGQEPVVLEAADPAFRSPEARPALLNRLLAAAAECFAAACVDAVVSAAGACNIPSYRDLCPSAFRLS